MSKQHFKKNKTAGRILQSDWALRTQKTSDSEGKEYLTIGLSNLDDAYDGATLHLTLKEAKELVRLLNIGIQEMER